MKCLICKHGETIYGKTTVVLNRNKTTIIIKDVPAEICNNCGEYYLSEEITEEIMNLAEKATLNNAEVEILRYVA